MRQVCARAALGMSVEATALELGIGKTSVLTYRQRAYQRQRRHEPFRAVCARDALSCAAVDTHHPRVARVSDKLPRALHLDRTNRLRHFVGLGESQAGPMATLGRSLTRTQSLRAATRCFASCCSTPVSAVRLDLSSTLVNANVAAATRPCRHSLGANH